MSDVQSGLNAPVQQPASEGQPQSPSGKTSAFGVRPAKETATQKTKESYFHSYKHDDGEEVHFKTPDELNKYIRDGTLRHRDYTKKTQETAELKKQIERERDQSKAESTAAMQAYSKWHEVDEWLTKKRPDIGKYIMEQMRSASPDALREQSKGMLDENLTPLKSELEELKKWKEEQEQEKRFQTTLSSLKEQHPDMDEEEVKALYRSLEEAPEGEEERALLELVHFAALGKKNSSAIRAPVTPGGRVSLAPTKAPFQPGDRNPFEKAKRAFREANRE